MSFSQASAVFGGPGQWKADVPDGWDIFGVTNGGFLMGTATRAMQAEADGRQLISATGSFLSPANAGPVEIDVEILKSGRSLSTLRATLSREGKSLAIVTASYAEADRAKPDEDLVLGERPELPAPDDCVRAIPSDTGPLPPPFCDKVDLRIHPEDAASFEGAPSGKPLMRGWFRLLDDESLDTHAIVMATDSFPPAIFNSSYPAGWTPTVDLTVQIRNPSPTGWLAGQFRTRFVSDGMLEEDGQLWDEGGRLVALSRQLALLPR